MGYLLGWRMTPAMRWLSETGISVRISPSAHRLWSDQRVQRGSFTRYAGISPGKYARQRAAA